MGAAYSKQTKACRRSRLIMGMPGGRIALAIRGGRRPRAGGAKPQEAALLSSPHAHTAEFRGYPQAASATEPLKDSVKNDSLSKLRRSKSDFFALDSVGYIPPRWVKPRDSVCDPPIVGCVKPRRLGV